MSRAMVVGSVVMMLLMSGTSQADVVIETVTVGDEGNVDDTHGDGYGGVEYVYNIGRHEVTNGQYAEFLNAVAASDPHGLYNTEMGSGHGGITRSGSSGSYTYSTIAGRANMPVNWMSWYDALRFANWMHNGQGSGDTEDGAYDMSLGSSVVRKPGALVFLPSENEWYKTAYYKGGGTHAGYWEYATQSDTTPVAEAPSGGANSANYDSAVGTQTNVGAYNLAQSAYGTFDQNGNVAEWNEALISDPFPGTRGARGGTAWNPSSHLSASWRFYAPPDTETSGLGFRVAEVSEPDLDPDIPAVSAWGLVVMALLGLVAGTVMFRGRRAVAA